MLDKVFPKIHAEGYKFLAIAILITIFLYFVSGFLGLTSLILTVWMYYFYFLFLDQNIQFLNQGKEILVFF